MKTYRGIVRGNTVLLEETPDLPDETPTLVELRPLAQDGEAEIAARHLAFLKNPPKVGRLLYRKREELYGR
jgi:hypothetical protein